MTMFGTVQAKVLSGFDLKHLIPTATLADCAAACVLQGPTCKSIDYNAGKLNSVCVCVCVCVCD